MTDKTIEYPIEKDWGNEDIKCGECGCYSPLEIIDKDDDGVFHYYSCQCGHEWGHEEYEE